MEFVFHEKYFNSTYADDTASTAGRMEAIVDVIKQESGFNFREPKPALIEDIERAHNKSHIESIAAREELFEMAKLAAGGTILASEYAMSQSPAFACVRPPGHHAYKNMTWGFCYFNNLAISLLKLLNENRINSAFILDFDAHTGDGTRDILKGINDFYILNPMSSDRTEYIAAIENYISNLPKVDIIAVSAGFDSYELDLGKKLKTFDFFQIGAILKKFSKKLGHNRRFASLEGGYYIYDLGKNVLAFCDGFKL